MSFGEGTGYQSPQKISADKAAALKAAKAAGKKGDTDPFNMNYGEGQSPQKNIVGKVIKYGSKLFKKTPKKTPKVNTPKVNPKVDVPKLDVKKPSLVSKIGNTIKNNPINTAMATYFGYDALKGDGGDGAEGAADGVADAAKNTNTDTANKENTTNTKKKSNNMPDSEWKKGQDKAKDMGTDLDALVKKRKSLEKGSDEWKRNQNLINEALGNSKRYDVGPAETKKEPTPDNSGKLPNATEKTDAVDNTIRPDMTVNVRGGGPAGAKKFEFQTSDGTPEGMREKERKTKGKSDITMEGKKIKQRNYDEQGNLESKTKEKYRRKGGGAEGGMADDYYSDKMKKRKVTVKDGDKVTKTKTKYNKDGTVKRQVTKTRKRRFVNLGRKLAGKRAGQRTEYEG